MFSCSLSGESCWGEFKYEITIDLGKSLELWFLRAQNNWISSIFSLMHWQAEEIDCQYSLNKLLADEWIWRLWTGGCYKLSRITETNRQPGWSQVIVHKAEGVQVLAWPDTGLRLYPGRLCSTHHSTCQRGKQVSKTVNRMSPMK